MDIATKWFLPPWKVAGGTKTLWYARYEAVRDAEIKRGQKLMKENK